MRQEIYIYNSLSRKKELLKPITKDYIGMYVCGPTVYGDPHLGHARPAITFDVVYRYLQLCGYKVRYVRNITDAGHLENDADEGEDKISKKARIEQLEPMEVAHYYTLSYHKAMNMLNCKSPSIEPRATGHIIEQIEMVKKIIDNGYAYEKNGSVYLDVNKYNKDLNYRVIGMGGSSLGTQAIYDFLGNKIKKKFEFIDNLQSDTKKNQKKKYLNLIVSKSGNTIETIVNTNIFVKKKSKNIFITENKDNYLRHLANKMKSEVIDHNNYIGGRYSVLSEVGMLPAHLMGLDVEKFRNLNQLIKNKYFLEGLIGNVKNIIDLSKKKNQIQ